MATLFKEARYQLNALVSHIDLGILGLPEIQRPFIWKNKKVKDLFDSMYKGYPVGYFLFWKTMHDGITAKSIGTGSKQQAPSLVIVDGQQRLTSLYAVLKGKEVIRKNFNTERIIISFRPLTEEFVIPDAASRRSNEYVQDISVIWEPETKIMKFTRKFIARIKESRELTEEEEDKIEESISKLKQLENYPFSSLELNADISEEDVADVFVRINSKGAKLNQADFVLTIMSVWWEAGRKQLEDFCRDARTPGSKVASAYNHLFWPEPDQLLRVSVGLAFSRARLQYVYPILRGKDLKTGDVSTVRRGEQFELLRTHQQSVLDLTNWHEFLKAVQQAGYYRGDKISSVNNIVYCYLMFLIGRERFGMSYGVLRKLIARWFFTSALTGRYTGSPESQMESDLSSLRTVTSEAEFTKVLDGFIERSLTNDFWSITLPGDLDTSASRSPSLFAYYAALNLLDAKVLFSDLRIATLLHPGVKAKKSALERHHLFPKAHLSRLGITDVYMTNQIANFALVEWGDNIAISDDPPNSYLPQMLEQIDEEERKHQYENHALWEGWEHKEYAQFLEERRRRIAEVIQKAWRKLDA